MPSIFQTSSTCTSGACADGYFDQLARYLETRSTQGSIRALDDAALTARVITESIAWFAWKRHEGRDASLYDDAASRRHCGGVHLHLTRETVVNLHTAEREQATATPAPTKSLPAFHTRPVTAIAVAFTSVELLVSGRYGFHRDELYFLACARHLAWGYVDQPPLVPALAWLSVHLLGTSPQALRILPALAGGATVVLAGLMARELGGGWRAQVLAALAAATSPVFLGTFHLLSTAAFDDLFW